VSIFGFATGAGLGAILVKNDRLRAGDIKSVLLSEVHTTPIYFFQDPEPVSAP
jgi:hypothetical protein